MSDALCGPSNALSQFKTQTQQDRTLQQDRLISRQSPAQGFRSANPNAGLLDPEFEAFQAGVPPSELPHFQPLQHLPQQYGTPAQTPAWAADFQQMHISSPPPFQQQNGVQAGPSTTNWAQGFRQHISQSTPRAQMAASSPQQFQQMARYGGMNAFQSGFAQPSMAPAVRQSNGKERTVEALDDAAFERAFNQARDAMDVDKEERVLNEKKESVINSVAEMAVNGKYMPPNAPPGTDFVSMHPGLGKQEAVDLMRDLSKDWTFAADTDQGQFGFSLRMEFEEHQRKERMMKNAGNPENADLKRVQEHMDRVAETHSASENKGQSENVERRSRFEGLSDSDVLDNFDFDSFLNTEEDSGFDFDASAYDEQQHQRQAAEETPEQAAWRERPQEMTLVMLLEQQKKMRLALEQQEQARTGTSHEQVAQSAVPSAQQLRYYQAQLDRLDQQHERMELLRQGYDIDPSKPLDMDRFQDLHQVGDVPMEDEAESEQRAREEDDALATTAQELLEKVQHNQSDKFRNSQFLGLMRKLRDREVKVEGDKMVETNGSATINADTQTLNDASAAVPRFDNSEQTPYPLPERGVDTRPYDYGIPHQEQDHDAGRVQQPQDGQEVVDLLDREGPITDDIDYAHMSQMGEKVRQLGVRLAQRMRADGFDPERDFTDHKK